MITNNFFTENEDLMLQFNHLVDFDKIIDEYEANFRDAQKYAETNDELYAMAPTDYDTALEYYREVLTTIGDIAGHSIASAAQSMDREGLRLQDGKVEFPDKMIELWNQVREAGLLPFMLKRQSGGLGLPVTLYSMIVESVARADISFVMAVSMLNLAETIERFASEDIKEKWLPRMVSAQYTGAMSLSEPNFGSDLSNVMTRAEKQDDGTYLLNGTKRFITHGCGMGEAPAAILTLARTGGSKSGARGLSFFVVDGTTVEVAGIEHKLGLKCSPTCEIIYENSRGELIGEEGYGLTKYAMGMMNGARLGVGMLGVGVSVAAYEEAKKYAGEREQFGKLIKDIPAVKKMLDRMEREIVAMRCLNMEAAYSIDMYLWRMERLAEEGQTEREIRKDTQIKTWEKIASLLTPLTKFYCSEMANRIAYDAIQIHGGVGYTEEFDVARIARDARILTIYEGTTQLQVVAAIGGITSGMSEKGYFKVYIEQIIQNTTVSEASMRMYQILQEAVTMYRQIDNKDYYASEVVEIAARFLIGLLFERSLLKTPVDKRQQRKQLSNAFNQESIAIGEGNLIRLRVG